MKDLDCAPIKDFAIGIYDGPHATPKETDEGPIFLGIKNVTSEGRLDLSEIRHVSEEEFPKWTRRITPKKDDIVFSYEATLHLYAIIPEGFRGCLGRRMALVRPNTKKIYPKFLLYYFLSPQWKGIVDANVVNGATVDRIPIKKFPSFKICVPEIKKQQSIADILAAYDDLIENNRRRIALLEESARLLYREWFVYLRFPGHEHVKVVDGVPEGWGKQPLGVIAKFNYGKALKEDHRVAGPYPVYGSSGIVGWHEKPLVAGPGIVVGRKGNVGSIYWSDTDFHPIDTVYFIDNESSSYYLYLALQHTKFINTDVAVPGLNRDLAHSQKILIPDKQTVSLFEEYITTVYKQIHTLQRHNDSLAKARDLLLPRLMNGELAV